MLLIGCCRSTVCWSRRLMMSLMLIIRTAAKPQSCGAASRVIALARRCWCRSSIAPCAPSFFTFGCCCPLLRWSSVVAPLVQLLCSARMSAAHPVARRFSSLDRGLDALVDLVLPCCGVLSVARPCPAPPRAAWDPAAPMESVLSVLSTS